eukprot:TRINITY_DN7422_c0_g1_i1.p1 TRINITY_DN7422_c0_g1~~TRINITY_DN7422_c0_g1_i1.p1  ORF type:complete len:303 (-),score=44.86 TRINITY_DN7422_c0_g1_i1:130-1038(-)
MGNPNSKQTSSRVRESFIDSRSESVTSSESSAQTSGTSEVQRQSDAPIYTSFSIEKGMTLSASQLAPDTSQPDGIITVIAAQNTSLVDPELEALRRIPPIRPLILGSNDPKWLRDRKKAGLAIVDSTSVLGIAADYQEYLRRCSMDINEKQKRLAFKIMTTERNSAAVLSQVMTHASDLKNYELQFREVERINRSIENINRSLVPILESMQRLYQLVPEEEELEPLQPITLVRNNTLENEQKELDGTLTNSFLSDRTDPKALEEQIFQSASNIGNILSSPLRDSQRTSGVSSPGFIRDEGKR